MIRAIPIFLACLLLSLGCSDTNQPSPAVTVAFAPEQKSLQNAIVKQAKTMQKAFKDGNLDEFIKYIHPDIVKVMGGAAKMKEKMAPELESLANQIEMTSLGAVSDVVVENGQFMAFLPVETIYQFPKGGLIQTTYRIACSTDQGQTWTFMEGQGKKEQEDFFRKQFPMLTAHVPFPECTHERVP